MGFHCELGCSTSRPAVWAAVGLGICRAQVCYGRIGGEDGENVGIYHCLSRYRDKVGMTSAYLLTSFLGFGVKGDGY